MDIFCSGVRSFLKTVVGKSVHDDVIMLPNETLDGSEPGEPSCGVNKQGFAIPELGQFILELHKVPKVES